MADIDFHCGRNGMGCGRCGLWLISSVADMVMADMVCGRCRSNSETFILASTYLFLKIIICFISIRMAIDFLPINILNLRVQ